MNIADILILATIIAGAFFGYMKGLAAGFLGFLSMIAGFFVASWQFQPALRWAEQHISLHQWMETVMYRLALPAARSIADSEMERQGGQGILEIFPGELSGLWESLTGPQVTEIVEETARQMAGALADRFLSLLAFVCVFCCVMVLLQLVINLVLKAFGGWDLPFNRIGGLVFGALSVLIGLSVAAALFWPLIQIGVGGSLNALIQSSPCYTYLLEGFWTLDQAFAAEISGKIFAPFIQGQGL